MPITPVTLPNTWEAIFTLQNATDPTKTWRNTFSFFDAGTPAPTDTFIQSLTALMVDMIPTSAIVKELAVYAWARGRQPYPTGTPIFQTFPLTPGNLVAAWGITVGANDYLVAGEVALRVDHLPLAGGRPGRSFFRSVFLDTALTSVAGGKWAFKLPTVFNPAQLQTVLSNHGIPAFFAAGVSPVKLVVVRYSPKTGIVHGSTSQTNWAIIGPTTNKQTRKSKK